ncbi:4Fe-4S dicluster domain-containing protein [Shewanella intestini]|uniref:4Fe-4S dicluster domain-containing protein n=1 Tax=Shewanella intestini TaxID=2017544 RepID=A0ABS5I299_9GAMM|nr:MULTISPECIES: 4Fe-4S dicluster domain-containing protein [Shewanella]MBR9728152.1 4Fe-4S dicluster domain-containing protein [Shewanella intestini]MRG36623.1 4Fe-4S dicluster domain-containing protein [Shewanella sp. XMDDZSB0408]
MFNRRQLLKTMGAGAVLSFVPYSAIASHAQSGTRWGMVIDLRRCTGCQSCEVSCAIENNLDEGINRNKVKRLSVGNKDKKSLMVPMQCGQCEQPTCVPVCPVDATYKADNGIVVVDYDKCIKCGRCVKACAYDARSMKGRKSAPEKCNFCYQRLEAGLLPACVESCIGSSRVFGDLNNPTSNVSKLLKQNKAFALLAEEKTSPNVFYIGLPEKLNNKKIIKLDEVEWQR